MAHSSLSSIKSLLISSQFPIFDRWINSVMILRLLKIYTSSSSVAYRMLTFYFLKYGPTLIFFIYLFWNFLAIGLTVILETLECEQSSETKISGISFITIWGSSIVSESIRYLDFSSSILLFSIFINYSEFCDLLRVIYIGVWLSKGPTSFWKC